MSVSLIDGHIDRNEQKMTDDEIIKALEICSTTGGKCTDCPAFVKVDRSNCKKAFKGAVAIINRQKEELTKNEKIIKAANDLIVTQKAEIESLIAGQETLQKYIAEKDAEIERLLQKLQQPQSEAVKEFAERLKEKAEYFREEKESFVPETYIDNLVKEMVGDSE